MSPLRTLEGHQLVESPRAQELGRSGTSHIPPGQRLTMLGTEWAWVCGGGGGADKKQ